MCDLVISFLWAIKLVNISICLQSLRPSDAYMCQQTDTSLVQIMACCLNDAKAISEPSLWYFIC